MFNWDVNWCIVIYVNLNDGSWWDGPGRTSRFRNSMVKFVLKHTWTPNSLYNVTVVDNTRNRLGINGSSKWVNCLWTIHRKPTVRDNVHDIYLFCILRTPNLRGFQPTDPLNSRELIQRIRVRQDDSNPGQCTLDQRKVSGESSWKDIHLPWDVTSLWIRSQQGRSFSEVLEQCVGDPGGVEETLSSPNPNLVEFPIKPPSFHYLQMETNLTTSIVYICLSWKLKTKFRFHRFLVVKKQTKNLFFLFFWTNNPETLLYETLVFPSTKNIWSDIED